MEYTDKITKQRIKKYFEQGKRFDGRSLTDFRELVIEKNVSQNAEGSVRIKLGKTEVIVGVKMEVGTPYPDSPNKGNLMVTSEFLPLSSPRIELGPPQFPSIELGRVVDRGIRESHFIDFEKLCIKEGEKVWTLMIDIYTINDDGNLFDAAAIGAVVALLDSHIPFYDEEASKIDYSKESKEKLPLGEGLPLSLTAYIIDDKVILDPTLEEEDLITGRVTLGFRNGIICSMQKGFEGEIDTDLLYQIFDLLENQSKVMSDLIQEKLK